MVEGQGVVGRRLLLAETLDELAQVQLSLERHRGEAGRQAAMIARRRHLAGDTEDGNLRRNGGRCRKC